MKTRMRFRWWWNHRSIASRRVPSTARALAEHACLLRRHLPHSLSAQLPAAARLPHRSALAAWNAPKAQVSAAPQRGRTRQCGVEYLSTPHCRVRPARRGIRGLHVRPCSSSCTGARRGTLGSIFIYD